MNEKKNSPEFPEAVLYNEELEFIRLTPSVGLSVRFRQRESLK